MKYFKKLANFLGYFVIFVQMPKFSGFLCIYIYILFALKVLLSKTNMVLSSTILTKIIFNFNLQYFCCLFKAFWAICANNKSTVHSILKKLILYCEYFSVEVIAGKNKVISIFALNIAYSFLHFNDFLLIWNA